MPGASLPSMFLVCLLLSLCSAACAGSWSANETGVVQCVLTLQPDEIHELQNHTNGSSFTLYLFLRYMSSNSTDAGTQIRIQGAAFPDVPVPNLPASQGAHKETFDPPSIAFNARLNLRPTANSTHRGYSLEGLVSFPLGPVVSALPSYLEASFTVPSSFDHDYVLTALDGGEGKTCSILPTVVSNRLDPQGIHVNIESLRSDSRQIPTEAAVIIKPLFNMKADLAAALIDRHLQHYVTIGFTRYFVNARPADVEPLLAQPRIMKWVEQGTLVIIKWDAVPEHPGKVLWDQRVVYTHAVLAHLGRPTFLLMADLDEYMVSLKPGPTTVFEMVQQCTGAAEQLVNLQLTRYHVIAKDWPDRTSNEQPLWLPETEEHPLLRYQLVNLQHTPYWKSMVNPNFIRIYYVHVGTTFKEFNATHPDPLCMALAHCTNLNSGREHNPARIAERYKADDIWTAALDRLGQQLRQQ